MVGLGALSGRVQRAEKAGSPRFSLYDPLFEATVECFIDPDQVEQARSLDGKRAAVVGLITRDSVTGRPLSVRTILSIEPIVTRDPGAYRETMRRQSRKPSAAPQPRTEATGWPKE